MKSKSRKSTNSKTRWRECKAFHHSTSRFTEYISRKTNKDPSLVVKKQKEGAAQFEEWYGVEYEKKIGGQNGDEEDQGSDSSAFSSSDEDEAAEETQLSSKAQMFFGNPVFKTLKDTKKSESKGMFDREMEDASDSSDDEIDRTRANKRKRKREMEEENKEIEIVPLDQPAEEGDDGRSFLFGQFNNLDNYAIETAQEYTLAQQLIRPSGKRDAVDAAFNRYAFNDAGDLPQWFKTDEDRHNKPSMPVTKEAIKIIRQQLLAMDARPIRKVAEAKFRKKARTVRRIEKMMKKAETMNDDEDTSEKSKLAKISKMMDKAKGKKTHEKPKLVVAKGMNRGNKGRPKGVSGRYKMVDSRMKKELKADKRKAKASKKRR